MYSCTHVCACVFMVSIVLLVVSLMDDFTCTCIIIVHVFSFVDEMKSYFVHSSVDAVPSFMIHVYYVVYLLLFLIESSLCILYPTIRRKLGMALNNLQPMDYSPHVILKPWIKVSW